MTVILFFLLAIFLTYKIGKIIFKNTIGTTYAYAWRYMLLFFFVLYALAGICRKLGLM